MMLENGYLDESDILGKSQSTIADGSNIDNVVINLRKVEIKNNINIIILFMYQNSLLSPEFQFQIKVLKL